MEAKTTSLHDEEFNSKCEALPAVSTASLRVDQPSTRALKVSSELADSTVRKSTARSELVPFQEVA